MLVLLINVEMTLQVLKKTASHSGMDSREVLIVPIGALPKAILRQTARLKVSNMLNVSTHS